MSHPETLLIKTVCAENLYLSQWVTTVTFMSGDLVIHLGLGHTGKYE